MPVPDAIAESNRVQSERLGALVGRLTSVMLAYGCPTGGRLPSPSPTSPSGTASGCA
jgi:hypothetical protein